MARQPLPFLVCALFISLVIKSPKAKQHHKIKCNSFCAAAIVIVLVLVKLVCELMFNR